MSDGECNEGSVWEGAMFAASKNSITFSSWWIITAYRPSDEATT